MMKWWMPLIPAVAVAEVGVAIWLAVTDPRSATLMRPIGGTPEPTPVVWTSCPPGFVVESTFPEAGWTCKYNGWMEGTPMPTFTPTGQLWRGRGTYTVRVLAVEGVNTMVVYRQNGDGYTILCPAANALTVPVGGGWSHQDEWTCN